MHEHQADSDNMCDDVPEYDIVDRSKDGQDFVDLLMNPPGVQIIHPNGTNQIRENLAQLIENFMEISLNKRI